MICKNCGHSFEKVEPSEKVEIEGYLFETIAAHEEVFGVVAGDKIILRCPNCKTKVIMARNLHFRWPIN